MNPDAKARSVVVTALMLAVAAVLWVAILVVLLFVVPRYERGFRDQGLLLPFPTKLTLAAARWAVSYWYLVPLLGLFVVPVIVLLSWLVRHRVRGAWPSWVWFGFLVGAPLVVQLGIWLTLQLP